MNSGPLLFLGVLATAALSFWTLVIAPAFQLGRQDLVEAGTGRYPTGRSGLAQRGADVYRSLGCVECHTQQVRPRGYGTDFERGWGQRRTVAQDYLRDQPVLLGSLRTGPDLANIGARQPDPKWHFEHLYDPRRKVPGSTMPPYRFLFERRSVSGSLPPDAWLEPVTPDVRRGHYEIVPTPEAHALVAYLLSLQSQVSLPEAPLPQSLTNAAPAEGTNAPAGNTNIPAVNTNPPAPVP